MKTSITALIFIFLLSGCGLISHFKMLNAFDSATISTHPFKEVLTFQEVNGFIIIEIEFEGDKSNFIFDTGATTKFDPNFASRLKSKKIGKIKTVDSNGKKEYIKHVVIDELKIKNTSFYNIVASVSSLEVINRVACVNVSGIIGANAMDKCIWQIDYNAKEITFTNQRDSLNLVGKENKSYFSATGKGVPTISIYSDNQYCGEAIFDTGFNGGINMDEKFMLPSSRYIESQTYNFSLYGAKLVSQKLAMRQSIELNKTISLNNQIISFQKDLPFSYVGNGFLKDYKVTIDWMYQEIYLDKYESSNRSQYNSLGFSLKYIDDKIVVGSIQLNSKAYESGLRLNDKVIKINEIDFSGNTYENYCEYLSFKNLWEEVELMITRNNQQFSFKIERKDLTKQIELKK